MAAAADRLLAFFQMNKKKIKKNFFDLMAPSFLPFLFFLFFFVILRTGVENSVVFATSSTLCMDKN